MNTINSWGLPLQSIILVVAVFTVCSQLSRYLRVLNPGRLYEVAAGTAFLLLSVVVVAAAFSDGFIDFSGEPSQFCQSAVLSKSLPVFRNVMLGEDFSSPYGPYTFILFYWPAWWFFRDPIFGAKLVGAGMFFVALLVTHRALRCIAPRTAPPWLYFILLLGIGGPASFWARPEPLMLFCVAMTVLARLHGGAVWSVLLGMSCAIGVNAKLLFPIYCLSLAATSGAKRLNYPLVLLGFAPALISPWLFPMFPFSLFTASILNQGASHYSLNTFTCALLLGSFLLTPIVSSLRSVTSIPSRWELGLSLFSFLTIAILSGKEGAGTYYFIPFAPVWATQLHRFSQTLPRPLSAAWIGAAALGWYLMLLTWYAPRLSFGPMQAARRDLENIASCASMDHIFYGQSDLWSYQFNSLRSVVCAAQGRNQLDPSMLFEQRRRQGELSPDQVRPFLESQIPLVLIPGPGVPFSMPSGYNMRDRAFGRGFTHLFTSRYCRIVRQGAFQLWVPKKTPKVTQLTIERCVREAREQFLFPRLAHQDRTNPRRRLRWDCRWAGSRARQELPSRIPDARPNHLIR